MIGKVSHRNYFLGMQSLSPLLCRFRSGEQRKKKKWTPPKSFWCRQRKARPARGLVCAESSSVLHYEYFYRKTQYKLFMYKITNISTVNRSFSTDDKGQPRPSIWCSFRATSLDYEVLQDPLGRFDLINALQKMIFHSYKNSIERIFPCRPSKSFDLRRNFTHSKVHGGCDGQNGSLQCKFWFREVQHHPRPAGVQGNLGLLPPCFMRLKTTFSKQLSFTWIIKTEYYVRRRTKVGCRKNFCTSEKQAKRPNETIENFWRKLLLFGI